MWKFLLMPLILISVYAVVLQSKYNAAKATLENLTSQLELREKEIKEYKAQRQEIKTEIITKYKKIILKDDSCENTLKSAKILLSEVGN